jgi:hypothetical protein
MSTCRIPDRHVHVGLPIKDVFDHYLVRCPHCTACATIVKLGKHDRPPYFRTTRLTCSGCAKVQEREYGGSVLRKPVDPHFGLPLWLQRPCCGKTLWAYNLHHVAFLEAYVGATLRSRRLFEVSYVDEDSATDGNVFPYFNQLSYLARRLPKWIISAKHRKEILRGIAGLREMALT